MFLLAATRRWWLRSQVADGSYIAAGSTITEDVPADALALGRARQTIKPEWAKKMRSRK